MESITRIASCFNLLLSLCSITIISKHGLLCSKREAVNTQVVANKGKKTDIGKQGLSSIKNAVVKNNLMGISSVMDKKGWVDSQGNKGKVCSVFTFMQCQ